MNQETLEINNESQENPFSSLPDNIAEKQETVQPSLLEQVKNGELDFRSLDDTTRNKILKEERNSLSLKEQALWDEGWRTKAFFGNKDRYGNDVEWIDAETFDKRFKISQEKNFRERVTLLEENKKLKEELEKISNLTKFTTERNLQAEEDQIEIELRKAKEDLDFEAYERVLDRKRQLQESKNQIQKYYQSPPEVSKTQSEADIISQMPKEERDAYLDFKSKNLWFGVDDTLSQFAAKEWESIQYANKPFKEKLDYVEKRTIASFPSKFPKQNITNFMPSTNNIQNTPLTKANDNKFAKYSELSEIDKKRIDKFVLSGKFPSREAVINHYKITKK